VVSQHKIAAAWATLPSTTKCGRVTETSTRTATTSESTRGSKTFDRFQPGHRSGYNVVTIIGWRPPVQRSLAASTYMFWGLTGTSMGLYTISLPRNCLGCEGLDTMGMLIMDFYADASTQCIILFATSRMWDLVSVKLEGIERADSCGGVKMGFVSRIAIGFRSSRSFFPSPAPRLVGIITAMLTLSNHLRSNSRVK
jgi:hypothetical protein